MFWNKRGSLFSGTSGLLISVVIPLGLLRHFVVLRQAKTHRFKSSKPCKYLLVHHFRRKFAHYKGKIEHYQRLSIHLSPCVYFCLWFWANTEIEWYKFYQFLPRVYVHCLSLESLTCQYTFSSAVWCTLEPDIKTPKLFFHLPLQGGYPSGSHFR